MARAIVIGNPQPYQFFGTFAGLPFWLSGLPLLAVVPGVGKNSWLLWAVFEVATVARPHGDKPEIQVENLLDACGGTAFLVSWVIGPEQWRISLNEIFSAFDPWSGNPEEIIGRGPVLLEWKIEQSPVWMVEIISQSQPDMSDVFLAVTVEFTFKII